MEKTSRRYKLNSKQIHALKLMYKFRFVTGSLLARYNGISRISSNKSLKILLEQGYIGQYFKKSYRIQGKGPRYYLSTTAIRYLRDNYQFNEQVLHALYKNKTVSEGFVDHNVDVSEVYLNLRSNYPDAFHIFTKTELGDFGYFPVLRPDLYLNRIKPLDDIQDEYMLDIFTDTRFFIIKKRVAAYIEHFESGDWEAEAETDYPTILMVCPDSRLEEKLQKHLAAILDSIGNDDLTFYTTTVKALVGSVEANKAVWTDAQEPEALLAL